jgi:hypothetical protein
MYYYVIDIVYDNLQACHVITDIVYDNLQACHVIADIVYDNLHIIDDRNHVYLPW